MNDAPDRRAETVSRYLSGDMSEEEIRHVEFAMLDDPELLEEVEAGLGLGIALRSVHPGPNGSVIERFRAAGRFRRPVRFPLALVASVVLAVSMGLGALLYRTWIGVDGASSLDAPGITAGVLVVPLATHRNVLSAASTEVRLSTDTSLVVLLPQVPPGAYESGAVTLRDEQGRALWKAATGRFLDGGIAVPASLLSDGSYELRVGDADGPDRDFGSYTFLVVGPDEPSPED